MGKELAEKQTDAMLYIYERHKQEANLCYVNLPFLQRYNLA